MTEDIADDAASPVFACRLGGPPILQRFRILANLVGREGVRNVHRPDGRWRVIPTAPDDGRPEPVIDRARAEWARSTDVAHDQFHLYFTFTAAARTALAWSEAASSATIIAAEFLATHARASVVLEYRSAAGGLTRRPAQALPANGPWRTAFWAVMGPSRSADEQGWDFRLRADNADGAARDLVVRRVAAYRLRV
jgi:hypothetical protein